MQETALSPLRRKVMTARAAGPEVMRAALRPALGRAGRVFPGGEVEAAEITVALTGLEDLLAGLPDDGLALSLLRPGPGGDIVEGLAHVAPPLLDALIEQAVTGQVRQRPAPATPPRAPTALDVALASDFLRALLAEMARAPGLSGLVAGLVPGAAAPGARALRHRMPPGPYRALACEVRVAPGGGGLSLWLNDTAAAPETAPGPAEARVRAAATWSARLAGALRLAPLPVTAVLHRQTMALRALQALAPGMRIELPPEAAANIRLAVSGNSDLGLVGRLGRARGRRAVQIAPGGAPPTLPAGARGPAAGADPPGD